MSTPDPTRQLLEQATRELRRLRAENERLAGRRREPIAVVGIGCRFPGGADDPASFWRLLAAGTDLVREIPPTRWPHDPRLAGLRGARWAGLLTAPLADFDAGFFALSPREATSLDPQQRLLLEVAWEALEDGGLALDRLPGRAVGVFVGLSNLDYQERADAQPELDAYTATGNLHSTAAGRISHAFDLQGPCLAVDTACSSSLVAVHLALRALQHGECELALAGGVHLMLSPRMMHKVALTQALAPDGRCKTFDARADGFVRAEGCGVLALKRLADAQRDGDPIHAVLRGSAVNHDGHTMGLTAPSPLAQERLLRAALADAGLQAHDIGCIEAHGTGTALGDPIEVEALQAVYGAPRADGARCALASLKTNLGHMEAAAGVGGLIEAILALEHELIPPHLHCATVNPRIRLGALEIPTRPLTWPRGQVPRRAAISSFGISGTNAHVIVEEAPLAPARPPLADAVPRSPIADAAPATPVVLLPISARSPAALRDLLARHRVGLVEAPPDLADLAHAIAVGRTQEPCRRAIVGRTTTDLLAALDLEVDTRPARGRPRVVFVCPGQGSQWPGMARQLLAAEPVFRARFHELAAAIRRHADWDLLEVLADPARLADIDVVQPTLWAISVALAAQWRAWGVEPDAVVGHSMGEVAAATIAGALTLDDAARVICVRSRLMRRLRGQGAMALVELDEAAARAVLSAYPELSIAALNGPRATVLTGPEPTLAALLAELHARDQFAQRIKVDVASHSAIVDPILAPLAEQLADLSPRTAAVVMHSTVTGERVDGRELGPDYWVRNLREVVRFTDLVRALADDTVFLELSPHPILVPNIDATLAAAHASGRALASLVRDCDEPLVLRQALGTLFELGHPISWERPDPARRRLPLPHYPWQRERFWLELPDPTPHEVTPRGFPGARRPVPHDPELHLWDTSITADDPAIADHRVEDRVVMPAAGYLALITSALAELDALASWSIRELHFERLLEPSAAGPTAIRLAIRRSGLRGSLAIHALAPGHDEWTRHASARLERTPALTPAIHTLADLRARCPLLLAPADHEARLAAIGLAFGPGYRCIRELAAGPGEALLRVRLPDGASASPALLDACLQALFVAAGSPPLRLLPTRIDTYHQRLPLPDELWCHAILRDHGDDLRGDLTLFAADVPLTRIAAITGLEVRAITRPSTSLYTVAWIPAPAPAVTTSPASIRILADELAASDALTRHLSSLGTPTTVVALTDPARLATPLPTTLAVLLADTAPVDPVRAATRLITSLAALVRELAARGDRDPPRLVFVTRGAQTVAERPGDRLDHAPVWGFARSVMHEHPELRATLIDLDPAGPSDAETVALARELLTPDREDQLALRRDLSSGTASPPVLRHAARLRLADLTPEPSPARTRPFALVQERPGLLDGLILRARPRPAPAAGEVLLAVLAAGLNFLDVPRALDLLPRTDAAPLGGECVGRVLACGPGVTDLAPGDRVLAIAPGCFATHVVASATLCIRVPPELGSFAAATLPIAGMTALYALDHVARLAAGERILIHAAAGGVGLFALELARARGAEIFATASSPAKRELLRARGADHVASSRDLSFVDTGRAATDGAGVDVVLNSLTGELLTASVDLLRPGGRFVEIGKRDYLDDRPVGLRPFLGRITWTLVDLLGMVHDEPLRVRALLTELLDLHTRGILSTPPHQVVPIADAHDAFAAMARGAHTGKRVLDLGAADRTPIAPPRARPLLRDDGTLLITGGTGGVGLSLARWFAAHGVRHLTLLARNPPSAAAAAAIAELRRTTEVQLVQADVADRSALAAALASLAAPLVGVVHAAGVLADGALLNTSDERLADVLAPKLAGAWNLHELTEGSALELFVLCSSASAVLGSPGQAGYAAANAFLAGLAAFRRARDLPALCVDWGAWDDVGLAAIHQDRGDRLARQGLASMSPAEAADHLGLLLAQGATQRAAMHLHARRWRESNLAIARSPFLDELSAATAATAAPLRDRLAALPPIARREALEAHVHEQVARILRRAPARLGLDDPLQQTGLDSLMAMELRNRLEASLGLALNVTLIWRHPSIRALAHFLADQLTPAARAPDPVPAPTPDPPIAAPAAIADLLATLTSLTRRNDHD